MQSPPSSIAPSLQIIGIAGRSGSGKSTLAHALAAALQAEVLSLDSYYLELDHLSFEERGRVDFDNPNSIDLPLLLSHLRALLAGESVQVPHYDFVIHTRRPGESHLLRPAPFLILEGLFTLHWPEVRALLAHKIFIELEDVTCFNRRFVRDTAERGRTPESVHTQYEATVRPGAESFVDPTRQYADYLIRGDAPLHETLARLLPLLKI